MYMHILFHVYSDKQKQVGSIIVVTDPLDKDYTESVNIDSSHDDIGDCRPGPTRARPFSTTCLNSGEV